MKRNNRVGIYNVRHTPIVALALAVAAGWVVPAKAYTFNTSPDWDIELDTDLSYSLGVRTGGQNPLIANNPIQQNNEFKFPKAGNIITNRVDVASELSVAYQNDYGFDTSVDGWKDFAYNGGVATNPDEYAHGVPYSALSSSPDGRYGSYTNNFYNLGGELENAFAFGNFQIGDMPVSVKVGRFTEYWGNSIFSGFQAISYGQSPVDIIKAVDAPGTELKDLFLPRGQASIHIQPTQNLTVGFQYQFEYRYNRFPEGGTYLGIADPFWIGPTTLEGAVPRGSDETPPNIDGNFGLEALWSPSLLSAESGTIGFYFRQFDDPTAYSPFAENEGPNPRYFLSYARHVRLYGLSLEQNIGSAGTNIEASIRTNTGLNTVAGMHGAVDPTGTDGARGTTFNLVGNALFALTPSRFWQTGSLVTELAWTHLMAVTHDPSLYNAEGYACARGGLNAGNGQSDGCSTADDLNANVVFDPQWLQVFPGIDFDAPMSVAAGLHGNGPTLALGGTGSAAGSVTYSAGINALVKQKYDIKLTYSGYSSPTGKITHTPLGQAYYSTGVGDYMWNDKANVELVLSTTF
jgi:hypothetical protein